MPWVGRQRQTNLQNIRLMFVSELSKVEMSESLNEARQDNRVDEGAPQDEEPAWKTHCCLSSLESESPEFHPCLVSWNLSGR